MDDKEDKSVAVNYQFFYLENGNKWRKCETLYISHKKFPSSDDDRLRNEVLAGQTLQAIKTHKHFSVLVDMDEGSDFLHTLFRAINYKWQDLESEIDLVRLKGTNNK